MKSSVADAYGMVPLPFDRVRISEDDGVRALTVSQFLDTPLPQRIRFILERRIEFFLGVEPVERRVALQALRVQKVG